MPCRHVSTNTPSLTFFDALVAQRRFNMMLLALFRILGLSIASVGIYGVRGYIVTQRRQEIYAGALLVLATAGLPPRSARPIVRQPLTRSLRFGWSESANGRSRQHAIVVCGAPAMDVTIPKSLEALVRRKVEEGHYSTEEEVVADALRLMQVRDVVAAMKRDRLRDALDRGYKDVAAGRVIQLETEDEIDALFASL
jgi:antitoxin ParD1/3/4